jgi:hypothetical protein
MRSTFLTLLLALGIAGAPLNAEPQFIAAAFRRRRPSLCAGREALSDQLRRNTRCARAPRVLARPPVDGSGYGPKHSFNLRVLECT